MLKPLGDRVVVTFKEEKEESVSGFLLAGSSHNETKKANVIAVGEGLRSLTGELVGMSVSVGQTVLVNAGAGVEVKDGEDKVTILREADILAIVK